jgi:prolyl oligopeptidase PreP (S9A serine peptidase family)
VAASVSDRPVRLRIERNAGHTGADRVKQAVGEWADTLTFLFAELALPPPGQP